MIIASGTFNGIIAYIPLVVKRYLPVIIGKGLHHKHFGRPQNTGTGIGRQRNYIDIENPIPTPLPDVLRFGAGL